jgi:hypothetical protein
MRAVQRSDRLALALFATALVAFTLLGVRPAGAHFGSQWYYEKWGDTNVNWRFTDSFPGPIGGAFRDRVKDGAREWNQAGTPVQFVHDTPDYADFFNGCPMPPDVTYQHDGIHWKNINFAVYGPAFTRACVQSESATVLHNFQMTLDSDDPDWDWYKGTGDPPTDEFDVWSVVAHEFGHATGFGRGQSREDHFSSDASECDESDLPHRQTMCDILIPITREMGRTYRRSLESHDQHTLSNAYPG